MIYLDYAATAPLREEALEAMLPLLKENFGNPDSPHSFGRRAAYAVAEARAQIADLLGVSAGEVYFTSGGTEADNWAVRCLGEGSALASPIEHAAVLSALSLRSGGGRVGTVQRNGVLSEEEFAHTMSEDTGLVCVMAVNNETGCVQPVEAIATAAHARGALLFCDCVQAACSQDLKHILKHADAISLSAHKVGGPKGIGALVVKKGVRLRPLIVGGEQERSLRGGTTNAASAVGFAKALCSAQAEREAFCAHTGALRELFEQYILHGLSSRVQTDGENRAPNISHLTFEGGGEHFRARLDLGGVACSGGAACSAQAALPSHVMLAMGRSEECALRGVRFSFGMQTTREEVLFAAETVVKTA